MAERGQTSSDRQGGQSKRNSSGGDTSPSMASIQQQLEALSYPISREEIIQSARHQNAPSEFVNALEQLSDTQYASAVDLNEAFAQIGMRGQNQRSSQGDQGAQGDQGGLGSLGARGNLSEQSYLGNQSSQSSHGGQN